MHSSSSSLPHDVASFELGQWLAADGTGRRPHRRGWRRRRPVGGVGGGVGNRRVAHSKDASMTRSELGEGDDKDGLGAGRGAGAGSDEQWRLSAGIASSDGGLHPSGRPSSGHPRRAAKSNARKVRSEKHTYRIGRSRVSHTETAPLVSPPAMSPPLHLDHASRAKPAGQPYKASTLRTLMPAPPSMRVLVTATW